jgi:hypothetical protein
MIFDRKRADNQLTFESMTSETILSPCRSTVPTCTQYHTRANNEPLCANHTLQSVKTGMSTEAEFLDVIGTKVLRIFLLAIQSHIY